jgi:2-succinyl-5-enolpyruvyl-6-hydroxy-3-cyclohexene-1-carboxylate synthase
LFLFRWREHFCGSSWDDRAGLMVGAPTNRVAKTAVTNAEVLRARRGLTTIRTSSADSSATWTRTTTHVSDASAETSPATASAFAVLETLVARGLEWVVVCPGARSQALALAAATLEREGALRVVVRLDERSAAFTALGIGSETGRPAAVVTTSGSAVANLHPAVLEAHHAGVPLILLTADRPEELRGIASNQTTVQPGIFGTSVRWMLDVPAPEDAAVDASVGQAAAHAAWSAALGHEPAVPARPGPVHLNLAFREPLSSAQRPLPVVVTTETPAPAQRAILTLARGPRTLVIAGANAGPVAELVAHEGGWPLVAEVSSGARFGRNLIPHYRAALADSELTDAIERIVLFGHPTLTRQVPALISGRSDIETIVVRSGGEDVNPGHAVSTFTDEVTIAPGETDPEWLGAWLGVGSAALATYETEQAENSPAQRAPNVAAGRSSDAASKRAFVAAELAAVRTPLTRDLLVDAVWRATWPHERLVVGASRIIRVADRVVPGKKIPVFANRGLAGIDGTVSTAAGIALASGALTRVLLGDITLLHDVGGLWAEPGLPRPRLQIVVANDSGGTIFDSLEVASTADRGDFDRVMLTPHNVDLRALAEAYGFDYQKATTVGELDQALTQPESRPLLIEVPLER